MKGLLFNSEMARAIDEDRKTQTRRLVKNPFDIQHGTVLDVAPYFIGEIIYVKETYTIDPKGGGSGLFYRADFKDQNTWKGFWKSPMFMPQKYARNFLKITDIRIERLDDISEEDALEEGVLVHTERLVLDEPLSEVCVYKNYLKKGHFENTARKSFFSLWKSINKKLNAAVNPYVWVITFEKISKQF